MDKGSKIPRLTQRLKSNRKYRRALRSTLEYEPNAPKLSPKTNSSVIKHRKHAKHQYNYMNQNTCISEINSITIYVMPSIPVFYILNPMFLPCTFESVQRRQYNHNGYGFSYIYN